jgi:hypothetical protein
VDPGGHHVTHVLLQTGRMRGRKEVAIPISAVTKIGTMIIHLSLTRHQVKDRPSGLMGSAPWRGAAADLNGAGRADATAARSVQIRPWTYRGRS